MGGVVEEEVPGGAGLFADRGAFPRFDGPGVGGEIGAFGAPKPKEPSGVVAPLIS